MRFMPREDCYYIISGERRYHASRAAGLPEVPCIEKIADDAETLEIGLIENMQRKDLTAFEEADGLHRLGDAIRLHARRYREEDRAGAVVGDGDDVAAAYSGSAAQEVRGAGDQYQRAVAADRAAAYREEDAGDDSPHHARRADAR